MARRVAITGAAGQLGHRLVEAFRTVGDEVLPAARPDFDITDAADLERLDAWRPDLVVNAAAWTDVDGCARDPERAMRINGTAAGEVAAAAARAGALVVQVSTNEVFDGASEHPYREDDPTNPINPYGASKLAGERLVADANPRHLIVRTAWLFDPERGTGFPSRIRAAAERMRDAGQPLRVVADEWGNPTSVLWLAPAIQRLATTAAGDSLVHLAGNPPVSRFGWAEHILAGQNGLVLLPISLEEYPRPSRVPPRAVLDLRHAATLGLSNHDWRSPSAS